jgi:hypothetical protein
MEIAAQEHGLAGRLGRRVQGMECSDVNERPGLTYGAAVGTARTVNKVLSSRAAMAVRTLLTCGVSWDFRPGSHFIPIA